MTDYVGLEVLHAASTRLFALRADELLEARTLPDDHDVVERIVPASSRVCLPRGWPD